MLPGLIQASSWLALAFFALFLAAPGEAATRIDPALKFRTRATPHFRIHYHQGEDFLASRLAGIAEDVWLKVGGALGVEAPRLTHVILADQSELANGWATPIPYNTIFVTAAAPAGSEFIGRNDDWLRLVFTHEFTHIVHLDRSEGWARLLRGVFGRTPVAFPNLWLPPWMIEGIATWQESALTGTGRLHAGDFRAIERQAGLARRVEPLDRVNGGLTDWPGGSGPYAFGLGFHEFLAERYGATRFAELSEMTARLPPFMGARAFDRIYGSRLSDLWRDYTRSLEERPATVGEGGALPRRLTHHGYTVLGPRFAPPSCAGCLADVIYSVRNPDGFPSLRAVAIDGTAPRSLATRYLGATVSPTAGHLVFDQQEIRRNVGVYSDLYSLDRSSGRVRTLTRDARLQDPDVSPDGRSIVGVREGLGRRDLVLLPFIDGQVGPPVTLASAEETHFNAPRWSPDGRSVAAARHRPGAQSEIVVIDPATGTIRVVVSTPSARIVTPAWRPDGRAIVAAADFDGEVFNLYEFDAEGIAAPRRLTETSGGAFWPDVSPDGGTLVFVGYTADGFDLFTAPYRAGAAVSPQTAAPEGSTRLEAASAGTAIRGDRTYTPWATLAPRSWEPTVAIDPRLRAGVLAAGTDVLGRHAYVASATWLVDRPESAVVRSAAEPDWNVAYAYDRWRPTLFATAGSSTLFFAGPPDSAGRPSSATRREREMQAGVVLPVRHVRVAHRAVLSLVRTSGQYVFPTSAPAIVRSGTRAGFSTATAHVYGYSVSPEQGVFAGGTLELVRRALGSSADATTATLDGRAYLSGVKAHHVVALRAAAGAASGKEGFGRTFLLGGAASNPDVLDFGRAALSLMRGFPANSFAGSRVAVVNADYRWPLARPQRGIRTWPVFLHTIHAAAFADVGETWTERFRRRDIKASLGGEISFNLITGYSFPLTATVGTAWGHDATDRSNRRTAYVRIGRAF